MSKTKKLKDVSLYVHIPFCKTTCHYCAFYKEIWTTEKEESFIKAVCSELKAYKKKELPIIVPSIFLGGGTPSLLSQKSLEKLFETITSSFKIESHCEITMETNPESVNKDFLKTIQKIGINRLSLGVQSFNNNELKFLGRSHTNKTIHKALQNIRDHSFFNFNLDLIFSLPNSTEKTLENSLNNALLYSPEHLSTYALSIEKGTVFDRKKIHPLESDTELNQYKQIQDSLQKHGYEHYEISAFAKPTKHCIHNRRYWEYKPFIGVGPSGHSYFNNHRYENESNLELYLSEPTSKLEQINQTKLSKKEQIEEFIMSNLRLKEGFTFKRFQDDFKESFQLRFKNQINKLDQLNLISISADQIKTSKKGQALLNTILEEFIT